VLSGCEISAPGFSLQYDSEVPYQSAVVFCFELHKSQAFIDMTASNRAHVYYGIGLVPVDFYLLNRNDSKKLIECYFKEGYIIKDFIHKCDKYMNIEEMSQEMPFFTSRKMFSYILKKRPLIVNILDKGLMAVIEVSNSCYFLSTSVYL